MSQKNNFEEIMDRNLKSVYNFVFRLCGNKNDADDIVQEIFLKVWKNAKKIDSDKNPKAWLFTIARNTSFDWMRKKRNIVFSKMDQTPDNDLPDEGKTFEENIQDIQPLPDEIFKRKELAKEVEAALSKLRPDFKEIILLRYMEDLGFKEISDIVGKPLNTIKSQHLRALNKLRKIMGI